MQEWQEFLFLILAGVCTGIVNTISGSGTLFSLGALVWLDVPIVLANTTVRLGVFFQNLSGLIAFRKFRQFTARDIKLLPIVITCGGAMLGAVIATEVSERYLSWTATGAMMLCLYFMLPAHLRPKNKSSAMALKPWQRLFLLFWVGFYGGYIQIGVGILMLMVLMQAGNMAYGKANASKLAIILVYTVPTTVYFALTGQILWRAAWLLAIGQVFGAFAAGVFIGTNARAQGVAKLVTFVMILLTLGKIWVF